LRIARLAAEGKTNREIALTLYLTLKTVEGHLARAYGKLGISGRRELPGALGVIRRSDDSAAKGDRRSGR
jgi:DNA-binding NarL/FixJ family response regulator